MGTSGRVSYYWAALKNRYFRSWWRSVGVNIEVSVMENKLLLTIVNHLAIITVCYLTPLYCNGNLYCVTNSSLPKWRRMWKMAPISPIMLFKIIWRWSSHWKVTFLSHELHGLAVMCWAEVILSKRITYVASSDQKWYPVTKGESEIVLGSVQCCLYYNVRQSLCTAI